ncbi:MAG: protein translocase subunit SecF [Clostridia bacterium]|nr:protein translocase subunit SecF [Clostridia bacterium]
MFIMKHYPKFMALSALIILVGIVMLIVGGGFVTDIDFAGGTMIKLDMGKEFKTSDLQSVIKDVTGQDATVQTSLDADNYEATIKLTNLSAEERDELFKAIEEKFSLSGDYMLSNETITPLVSSEIIFNALLSIIIASVLILIYIAIRFAFAPAIASIVALINSVLVMVAYYAIFRQPVNASFIAALLTIIGYAINDTIVTFDRIRENKRFAKNETFKETCEKSIRQTMRRTINTSLTTLFSLVVLAILGESTIRAFVIPLIVGVVAGTYSSIFVATPMWYLIDGGKGNTVNRKKKA